jgi:hypothetical protein
MWYALQCVIYLTVGISLDVLITLQLRAVISRRRLWASLLSMSITGLGLLAVDLIISREWIVLGFYVVGTGLGTFIGMSVGRKKPAERSPAESPPVPGRRVLT